MENMESLNDKLVTCAFKQYYRSVYLYFYCSIGIKEEAEDLSQDTFLRLSEYGWMLRPDTVKGFLFAIARNLKMDYLRRYYKREQVAFAYFYGKPLSCENMAEQQMVVEDILSSEKMKIQRMPLQRRKVYSMVRFEGKSVSEIASCLNLSMRTVENHLSIGRKEIRSYLCRCI